MEVGIPLLVNLPINTDSFVCFESLHYLLFVAMMAYILKYAPEDEKFVSKHMVG